mmetsp:Transcript_7007/g.20565  ORF Transcript_7007/g.20565 Transcript_7007/m.20565 type:complete len:215 (-) Transcript_7007:63-707(-)
MGVWARIDGLLDAPKSSRLATQEESDDGEYAEVDSDIDSPRKRGRPKKDGPPKQKKGKKDQASVLRAKRLAPRTLAQVLLEDLCPSHGADPSDGLNYATNACRPARPRRPPHRVCVVTGRAAPYRDPETNALFADAEAGALLRENPPPWLGAAKHGSPYYEALLQIRAERSEKPPEPPKKDEQRIDPTTGFLLAPGQMPGDPDPPGWYRGRRFE